MAEKVQKHHSSWKITFFLRKEGCLSFNSCTVIHPVYFFCQFKISSSISYRFERIMRGFRWVGVEQDRILIGLDGMGDCSRLVESGGLSIGNIRVRNEILQAKWL